MKDRHYLYSEEITAKPIKDLIDWIEKTEYIEVKKIIYFNSGGGEGEIADVITDILNRNKNQIILCAFKFIGSAAFDVFYNFEGEKKIMFGTKGMTHFTYETSNAQIGYENSEMIADIDTLKSFVERDKAMIKKMKLTKKEIDMFLSRKDVYFSYKRMKQLFS